MPETDRRSSRRFKISQMIGYYPSREEYLWAEGIDLSRGGVSCVSKHPIDPMTNIFLMLAIPGVEGERVIRCEGYVAHSRMEEGRCYFGVRIQHIDPADQPFLEAFFAQIESEGEEAP